MALKDFMIKSNAQMAGHITVGGYLAGPSNLVIDPAGVGDDTGTVEVKGNLQVNGTTTTVNSTTLDVADINITVAKGAANAGAADGAGLTVDGASATLTYASTGDKWVFNKAPFYNTDALLVASDLSIATDATPAGDGGISYDPSTKQFTYTPATLAGLGLTDTDNLTEGTTNLYFTNARADTRATLRITAADIGNLNNVDETGVANNKILKYTSTSSKWEVADESTPGIANLVEDTSPQLGGDLDVNGQKIVTTSNGHILIEPNGLGKIGIGSVTSPDTIMHFKIDEPIITIQRTDNTKVPGLRWEGAAGYEAASIRLDGTNGTTNTLIFKTFDGSSNVERLRLMSTAGAGAVVTGSLEAETLISTIATGTAPLTVTSTTMVSNLNADKLDDKEFTDIIAEATALAIALGQNMAQTFKNYTAASIGSTPTTVYTVASATTSILIGVNLANRTASQITVSAQLGTTYIVKDAPIPSGGALSVLEGKIIAEAADTIVVTSDTSSSCDAIVSVLEQT